MLRFFQLRAGASITLPARCLALLISLLCFASAGTISAVTVTETFATDPLANGWKVFGNTNLFHWNATNQNLEVTWDSSQTNSYFYQPLGTILTWNDDFRLSFDLTFQDYAIGTTPNKPDTFQAAVGLLNWINATNPVFSRGAGGNAVYGAYNLVEFNFFPAYSIYQPTIGEVIVPATNNAFSSWRYSNNLLDMTPGELFHVDMNFSGTLHQLTTTVTNRGAQYGSAQIIRVFATNDFRVATFSITSYSDQRNLGSILAHGIIDNVTITTPSPPIQNLRVAFTNSFWQVAFTGQTNWSYTLESTTNFQSWTGIASTNLTSVTNCVLKDSNPSTEKSFYRVRANRP